MIEFIFTCEMVRRLSHVDELDVVASCVSNDDADDATGRPEAARRPDSEERGMLVRPRRRSDGCRYKTEYYK